MKRCILSRGRAGAIRVVTSDHGTNIGERGGFGKSFPVHEQEGHVPLMIGGPDIGTGRIDAFVQPQDIFATILDLGGESDAKRHADGRSLIPVIGGRTGERPVAISGQPATHWNNEPQKVIFTVFSEEHYLTFAPDPAACSLVRYDTVDDVSADNQSLVASLREEGLREVESRGVGEALMKWLRSEGKTEFPAELPGRKPPSGYRHYWQGNFNRW